jgi:hypothetical protein
VFIVGKSDTLKIEIISDLIGFQVLLSAWKALVFSKAKGFDLYFWVNLLDLISLSGMEALRS